MRKSPLIYLLLIGQILFFFQQTAKPQDFEGLVSNAIALSEKSLFDANLKEALNYVETEYFERFSSFDDSHKIQFALQRHRIRSFENILTLSRPDHTEIQRELIKFLPAVRNLKNKGIAADFYRTLSGTYRSIGDADSAITYEQMALDLYMKKGRLDKVAEIRAGLISYKNNEFLRSGRETEVLSLIPEYEKEIEFSSIHSKYALAYNTRHLAQIHLRQTRNYEEALRLFEKSLKLREEIGFRILLPASYSSVGDAHLAMENFEKSIASYGASIKLAEQIGFVRYQYYPRIRIGDIHLKKGDKKRAGEYYSQALDSARSNNFDQGIKEATDKIKLLPN